MAHSHTADTTPTAESTRRDFLYVATSAVAGIGAVATLIPLIVQMNPSADVLALASVEIDLTPIQPGQTVTFTWRSHPLFVRRRTPQEIAAARAVPVSDLLDTLARNANFPDNAPATDDNRLTPNVSAAAAGGPPAAGATSGAAPSGTAPAPAATPTAGTAAPPAPRAAGATAAAAAPAPAAASATPEGAATVPSSTGGTPSTEAASASASGAASGTGAAPAELPEWLVVVGVCTHLGCTPTASTALAPQGDYGGWLCHCHGSQYDVAGRVRRGPAPQNLAVPPYTFLSSTRIRVG
ncbi:MAG TPA: ubiquinol-cytochrome c reductase iron-sulfur subunit [Micropepsaceae bacterium]|nr:ubiquinol-cytochrome c reductase iron-sulfur subunit [Micropepsaceae bacterium]